MNSNLAPLDRAIRGAGGLFLLATPLLDLHTYPLNLLGLVLIATAAVNFCPLYALAGRVWRGLHSGHVGPRSGVTH